MKSLIRHLGLAIGNVRCVRWFSWTLLIQVSSFRSCSIHLKAISQWVPKLLFCIMSLKIVLTWNENSYTTLLHGVKLRLPITGYVTLVAITGTTLLVPYIQNTSMQLIWRSLGTLDFIYECLIFKLVADLTGNMTEYPLSISSNHCHVTCPCDTTTIKSIRCHIMFPQCTQARFKTEMVFYSLFFHSKIHMVWTLLWFCICQFYTVLRATLPAVY